MERWKNFKDYSSLTLVRDEAIYPIETIVRRKKTGEFAIIKNYNFQHDGKGFLNYLGLVEGKGEGLYALYHDDIEFEWPPLEVFENLVPVFG